MRHVLVIEDQYLIGQCVKDMAVFAGASSVDLVDSADAAVAAAIRHRPSVIVSDVDLGSGRGPEAVARIRAIVGRVPTIFLTADPDDRDLRAQATAILVKPCAAERFARTFAAVVAGIYSWRGLRAALVARTARTAATFH